MFNIKIKTKNGNDVKKKEMFTAFFKLNYKRNTLTNKITAEYTYKIIYSGGVWDTESILKLKDADKLKSLEDFTLKVILNICHRIGKLKQDKDITPDYIMFISPDFSNKNRIARLLKLVFTNNREQAITLSTALKTGVVSSEVQLLSEFIKININTKFLYCDPYSDEAKYYKSIIICDQLKDRLDISHQLQITNEAGDKLTSKLKDNGKDEGVIYEDKL